MSETGGSAQDGQITWREGAEQAVRTVGEVVLQRDTCACATRRQLGYPGWLILMP